MALRRAPLEYNRMWQMRLWLFGVFFFLYAPLVALIAFSFNDSKRNIVWRGFTLDYYKKLFNDQVLMVAFANSLTIAFLATIISLAIGALAAILLWRYRFVGKTAVEGAFTLPLVVPEICMGVSMLLFSYHGPTISSGRSVSDRSSSPTYRSVSPSSRSWWARDWRASTRNRRRQRATSAPTIGRPSATSCCRICARP